MTVRDEGEEIHKRANKDRIWKEHRGWEGFCERQCCEHGARESNAEQDKATDETTGKNTFMLNVTNRALKKSWSSEQGTDIAQVQKGDFLLCILIFYAF